MINVLQQACDRLLAEHQFWILAGLTDRSFEEGERNAAFREAVDWYDGAGLPAPLSAKLRMGINVNLAHALRALDDPPPNIEHTSTRSGKYPDVCYGHNADGSATIVEVKPAYDMTMPKWYPIIAADGEKLINFRAQGHASHLLQVVFFLQLPNFDYPAGSWYGSHRKCPGRSAYPGFRGIQRQYAQLRRYLPEPTYPADDAPQTVALHLDPCLTDTLTR